MERLNKLRNKKNANNDANSKFRAFKKSEFIGEKAKMLQQQIQSKYEKEKENNEDNNDSNSSDSEKNNKNDVSEIINSKPIALNRRKKSRMVFLGDNENDYK